MLEFTPGSATLISDNLRSWDVPASLSLILLLGPKWIPAFSQVTWNQGSWELPQKRCWEVQRGTSWQWASRLPLDYTWLQPKGHAGTFVSQELNPEYFICNGLNGWLVGGRSNLWVFCFIHYLLLNQILKSKSKRKICKFSCILLISEFPWFRNSSTME